MRPFWRVSILAGMLTTFAFAADAQTEGTSPRIGLLRNGAPGPDSMVEGFRQGLRELGYVEGRNIRFEFRWAEGKPERFPELAAELVRLPVDVIVAAGPQGVRAAQQATSTIPIVMAIIHEPVAQGFVASFARPGGNTTGLSFQDSELSTKRLELLKGSLPGLTRVAALWDPTGGGADQVKAAYAAARALGLTLHVIEVRDESGFHGAFQTAKQKRAQAVLQLASPFFSAHQKPIAELALAARLPMTCEQRLFVVAGCLMSYGPDFTDMYRRAAAYVDRILKGAKPGELPVEQADKFELVINTKTAKSLGLRLPQSILGRADQLIQ